MAKKATKMKKIAKKAAPAKKKTTTMMVAKKPMMATPLPVKKATQATRPRNGRTLSYTQSEFIENIKDFCGLMKRSQAKELCEDMARFITDSLRRGYKLPLLGLGKMYVRQTKARTGRNPATGEIIQISPKKRVRFTAAKSLKEAVLR